MVQSNCWLLGGYMIHYVQEKNISVHIYIYIYILKREKISLKIMTNRSKASSKSLSSSIVPNTSYMSSISVINTPTLVSILLQYPNCGSNFTPTIHKKVSASLSLAKGNFCPRLVPLHHLYIYIYICVCVCVCVYIYIYIYIDPLNLLESSDVVS